FRIVGRDGEQRLVEVKGVSPQARSKPASLSATEVRGLERYGELTGAGVSVAHYWAGWNRWTLVPIEALEVRGSRHLLPFESALMANELGRFGDRMLATRPPLTLTLDVEPLDGATEDHGHFNVRIERATLFGANGEITDETDHRIAMFAMLYGDWPATQ